MELGLAGTPGPDGDEIARWIKEWEERARRLAIDRHQAIVAGVDLEESLGRLLAAFMADHKPARDLLRQGSAGNFSGRINLAHALGLISRDEFRDLHTMREIRNRFAHGKEQLCFGDEEIRVLCDKLLTIRKNVLESLEPLSVYMSSSVVLGELLVQRQFLAERQKRIVPDEIDPQTWQDL